MGDVTPRVTSSATDPLRTPGMEAPPQDPDATPPVCPAHNEPYTGWHAPHRRCRHRQKDTGCL